MSASPPIPADVSLIRRKVSRARIEIKRSGEVVIIAPPSYPETRLREFYHAKSRWVAKTLARFSAEQTAMPPLPPDGIRLFGEWYRVVQDDTATYPAPDHATKVIRTKHDLLGNPNLRGQWLKHLALIVISEGVKRVAAKHGFSYGKISIRAQKTKWGSCSADNNLSFNFRLISAPPSIIEYLVCHELAHTVHHHHGPDFWQLVQKICPDYISMEQWLRDNERELLREE